ncbi:MAG: universal stress protein, partial [Bacteroidia bacterium]
TEIEKYIYRKPGHNLVVKCECACGFPIDEINSFVEKNNVDLIVMGMRGGGYLSEKLIGSITTGLIKKSNCPVLVINKQQKFKKLKKIVLAYDYKKVPAKLTLGPLKEFVKLFQSKVYVLNVVNGVKKTAVKKSVTGIEECLEGIDHSFHFVENEDTISGINEFVSSEKADMIAIIPRRHKFMDTILHERNTKRMAFHTSIPLLALHDSIK